MRTAPTSAALPVAHLMLRILMVLNAFMGACIVILLVAMPNRAWIMASFDLTPGPDAERLIAGMRIIAIIGLVAVVLNHQILKRLRAMVDTVREGDPFVPANATRLQAIAWTLLTLQLLSITIAAIARFIAIPGKPLQMSAGFSVNAWLAILLTFLLARVFAEGTRMREDLEGTI